MPNKKNGAQDVLVHPYEKISKKLRVFKLALIFVLIAFLLGGLFVLRDEFTAENLRFLARDIGFSSPSIGLDTSGLSFDYDTSLHADLYRSDLVLLKRSSLEVYSFSGSRSLSTQTGFSSPALVTGDKYMLAYDIGGTKLSICNSFSELYTEDFEYKIACADLADDGTFAVVVGEKGYHSALYVYNSNFSRIYRYASAERVVFDVAVCRDNPNLIALSTVRSQDGDFLTELLLFNTTRAKVEKTVSFPGEMPLDLAFETDGHVSLLTDSSLHLIAPSGDVLASHGFAPEDLADYHAQDGYEVLVKNSGIIGTTLVIDVVYPDSPDKTESFSLQQGVHDIQVADSNIYLLSHNSLSVYSLHNRTLATHELQHEYKQILPLSGGRIAFVGEGYVSIYMVG